MEITEEFTKKDVSLWLLREDERAFKGELLTSKL